MKSKTIHFFSFLFPCLFACSIGHAYEQDNWYLANEWSLPGSSGVAYYEDNATGIGQIYATSITSDDIKVYDLNGSLARTIAIASDRFDPRDICIDIYGTIYIAEQFCVTCLGNDGTFRWRTGKNSSISGRGTNGSANGQFNNASGILLHKDSNLYIADRENNRIQVLDKNGSFIRIIGGYGTAPGFFKSPADISQLKNGNFIVSDQDYLHLFDSNGSFLKRTEELDPYYVSSSDEGLIFAYKSNGGTFRSSIFTNELDYIGTTGMYPVHKRPRSCFTPSGDLITSIDSKLSIWKRAFRTKGQAVPNVIPQPAIRSVSQRAGTNILDLDFEILDSDDATATVGILAYAEGTRILPQAWTDGTDSKIGVPIATNQVHRVSWDVKQDWTTSTGEIKFEILCQDANRTKPVDLHFLTLPLPDGNLTISRSPLKDSDFTNYAKYLLAIRTSGISYENGVYNLDSTTQPPVGSIEYVFNNCGVFGYEGPTMEDINSSYQGTSLEGKISMSTQGIQRWTVPENGLYAIETAGASGGHNSLGSKFPGLGAYARGNFNLQAGQILEILVGQLGSSVNNGAGGGGGTFVVDSNGSPLIISGGGGGAHKLVRWLRWKLGNFWR